MYAQTTCCCEGHTAVITVVFCFLFRCFLFCARMNTHTWRVKKKNKVIIIDFNNIICPTNKWTTTIQRRNVFIAVDVWPLLSTLVLYTYIILLSQCSGIIIILLPDSGLTDDYFLYCGGASSVYYRYQYYYTGW